MANICIDFDGSVVAHEYPMVGSSIGAQSVLKELISAGHRLILFTMRSNKDNTLHDAVDWFKLWDIELWGIQSNPTQKSWTDSPKAYADYYIDDSAIGIPLTSDSRISSRPFVDWVALRELLVEKGLLKNKHSKGHGLEWLTDSSEYPADY